VLKTIGIVATTRCNLRCAHCLRGYPEEHYDFSLDLLERLLNEARPFGAHHVALTGGEPCLHPDFEQMVEMVVDAGYTWHFVSNSLRTEPYESLMKRYRDNFRYASLSIDGADAATHDELRGREGAFEAVTSTARRYTSQGFPVSVAASLNQRNKTQVEDLIGLAKELGAYRIGFGGTIPTPWNEELVLSESESLTIHQQIEGSKPEVGIEIRTVSNLCTSGGVHFCDILDMHELAFNARGELVFCCDVPGDRGTMGTLLDQPLSALITDWLQIAADLQAHRAKRIAEGQMGEGFDTCAFCSGYFSADSQALRRR